VLSGLVGAVIIVSVSVLAAGCTLDQTGSLSSQVQGWMKTAAAGAAIGQVEDDSRNVGAAISDHNSPAQIKTACALLTTDAQTAIGNLPTPDTQLTDQLNTAYEDAAGAGNDCFNGAGGNTSLMHRSADERAKLPSLLGVAVQQITSDIGHTPSTSTTAPTDGNPDPFAP
jgi:hypothetical protein